VKQIDLKSTLLNPKISVDGLLKEAEIMKNLQHPHIVSLADVFADKNTIYLVMELLSGKRI
jgi:serine/threonine protein kinase